MVVLATVAAWATIVMIDRAGESNHKREIDRANPARYNQLAPRTASGQCIRMSRPLRSTSPLVLEELPLSVTRRDDRGSDDELEERDRVAKRRRIEQLAEEYRHGQTLFIASAALRGPLDHGDWGNPWRKKRPVRRQRSRITNDKEGTGDQRCRTQSRRRRNGVRRGETSGEHPKKKRTPKTPPGETKNRDSRDGRQPPRSRTMERTLQPDQLPREENTHAKPHPQETIDSGIPGTGSDTKPGSTSGIGPSPTKPREHSGARPHPQSMTKSPSTERVGRNSDHPPEMGSALRSEITSWSTVLPLFASNGSTEHQDGLADSLKLEQDIEDAGSWLHQSSDINWDLSRCSGKSGTNPQNPVSTHGVR